MKLPIKKIVETEAKYIETCLKVTDQFTCTLLDADSNRLADYNDYVPSFMPDDHYGDYVMLKIDIDTGMIVNWRKNIDPRAVMKTFFESEDEENV